MGKKKRINENQLINNRLNPQKKSMNKNEIMNTFDSLRVKYKDDADILSDIDREEKNLEYILKNEQEPGYNGQTAEQHLKMFIAETEYWN